MNWNEVTCYKCGSINDYKIEVKGGQNCCYCNGCNAWLGNKPKGINEGIDELCFPFGKYKGRPISECTDQSYLEWAVESVHFNERFIQAFAKRLLSL